MGDKEKVTADPGDEARERAQGPMERVDEEREMNTVFDQNEIGVPRVTVHRQRLPEGGGPVTHLSGALRVTRSPMDDVRRAAEVREELLEAARRDVVPGVCFYADGLVCAKFQGHDGNRMPTGAPTWCRERLCPSWSEGKCIAGFLSTTPMLTRSVQPKDHAEYEKLITQPGAATSSDYPARLEARIAEIMAKRREEEALREAEQRKKDNEARAAARAERNRPHFEYVRNDAEMTAARARARGRVKP